MKTNVRPLTAFDRDKSPCDRYFSDSPFGNPAFRRSINRKSGRNFRRSMRRQERPKIEIKNVPSNGGGDFNSNVAIENSDIDEVNADIDDLSDQMNEMTRRMLRIEEERQVNIGGPIFEKFRVKFFRKSVTLRRF